MVDLPDVESDEQDLAEVYDEDNTNIEAERHSDMGDAEQAEDRRDVYDVTTAVGDDDDEAGLIGEDMDDDEIIASASDELDEDLDDDDLVRRDPDMFDSEDELDSAADVGGEDLDDVDGVEARGEDEVELEYAGDLADLEGAQSSAADMESDALSDEDLRELDYTQN